MITSVDFPDPGEMWVRWVSFAAAFTAAGFDDTWTVTAAGAHRDDGGGNWAHLALVEGGRAVLWGYDHEYSETCDTDPPLDLLADAPQWLPWPDLTRLQAGDQLGYVLWFDGGWFRTAYPAGVNDGLAGTAGAGLTAEAAAAELDELVWEWGEYDDEDDRDQVGADVARLLELAGGRAVGPDALAALVGRLVDCDLDLPAGLAVARRGGITPDGSVPIIAAGQRPAHRRVRVLSQNAHDKLVWAAMREATELNRPEPVPTGELGALVTWLRAKSPAGDGRTSLLFYADDSTTTTRPGEYPPRESKGFETFHEAGQLVRRLREAEAHPARGRWLFLRVETTAHDFAVHRCYDSWPQWWADNGVSGPWRSHLLTEVAGRIEPWRPAWANLLEPGVAYRRA